MEKEKIVGLITGVCSIIIGASLLIAALTDMTIPKPLVAIFSIACLINAILILRNYRKNKNKESGE